MILLTYIMKLLSCLVNIHHLTVEINRKIYFLMMQTMVCPVVTYGCERWTVKKAEHQRIDAFELWCWRRLLRVPWTARRSNQSWVLIGMTDAEGETPIIWPPDEKS